MPEDTNISPWSNFFFPGDKNDPRVNPQLRQRIALAMMAQKRAYPKTLGEGIAAVGENFANAMMQRQLEQADVAQQDEAKRLSSGAAPAAVSSVSPVALTTDGTSQPQVIPPPASPPATVPQQAPGRGFTPVPMQPGAGEIIDPGEYNAIDAADPRNRYKPAPAYLQPALERNIQDPERRAYLGQLAGKEAQRPGEVSPTGAAGPFQFTRGTGAQYGIPGNARFDPDASTLAANAFTDDNVKALTAGLGREPTPGEMALAHQQGAGTAANMLTGAGNAPARNLAVNNVPPSMGPQAAAQKVMGYYGMPGPVGGGRDAVAAALLQQQQPSSGGRPTVADYGQPRALAATPPGSLPPEIATGASAISAAPPQPSGIRAAPPQQVAQAAQKPDFGYIMPTPPEIPPLKATPLSPEGQKAQALMLARPNNQYVQQEQGAILAEETRKQALADKAANEDYTAKQTQRRELMMQQQKQIETKALREATGQEAQSKASMATENAAISTRIGGGDPEKFLTEFQKERDAANQSVNVLKNSKLAKQALNDGIVSGAGADFRVNMEKLKGLYGNESASQLAARSEQYLAAVKSTLSGAIQNIQGNDPKVTNSDVMVASGTIGADLNYQNETLHKLVDQTIQSQHQRLNRYEDLKDYYLGGTKREKMFDVRTDETASKPYVDRLIENSNNKDARDQFDRRFGPGSAELEIARAQRQARKKGGG